MIRFSMDGARMCKKKGAVQGCIKIIDVNCEWKPKVPSKLPKRFTKENCLFIFVGKFP